MKRVIALLAALAAVVVLLFAFHVVKATAKQQAMDNAALRQWSMEYRAIHP